MDGRTRGRDESEQGARSVDEPARVDLRLITTLRALSDPVRLSIVSQLARAVEPMACGAVSLAVSASTATHHFAVLREAGIIHQFYVGTSRLNLIRTEDLDARFPGLLDSVLTASAREATPGDAAS